MQQGFWTDILLRDIPMVVVSVELIERLSAML
jgi:hypothetical protein